MSLIAAASTVSGLSPRMVKLASLPGTMLPMSFSIRSEWAAFERHALERGEPGGALVRTRDAPGNGRAVHRAMHQEQRLAGRHRHVRMKRIGNAGPFDIAEPHHVVGALRSKALLRVGVGERAHVIGVGADDHAEPLHAVDLILLRNREVDGDRAVVVARMAAHVRLDIVEHHVEARVAVDMDMDLVAGVPVDLEGAREDIRIHDPFAMPRADVGFTHLHGEGIDGAVSEELDRPRRHRRHALAPAQHLLGLADRRVRERRADRFAVRDEIEAEGAVGPGQDRVLRVLKLLREEAAGFAAERHAVGVIVAHDEFEAAPEPVWRGDRRKSFGMTPNMPPSQKWPSSRLDCFCARLGQAADEGRVDAVGLERLRVDDEFVGGAVPDDDRPAAADPVEIGAGERPMEHRVIAPGHQQRGGVLELRVGFGETLAIFVGVLGGRHDARRQDPILDGDDLRHHRQARQERMIVLGDEARRDNLVREGLVDT